MKENEAKHALQAVIALHDVPPTSHFLPLTSHFFPVSPGPIGVIPLCLAGFV